MAERLVEFVVRVLVEVDESFVGEEDLPFLRVRPGALTLFKEGVHVASARLLTHEHAPGRVVGWGVGLTDLERAGLVRCERLAAALASKGFVVHVSRLPGSAVDHREPHFWHLCPLSHGGVGVSEFYGGISNTEVVAPGRAGLAVEAVSALDVDPSWPHARSAPAVWTAMSDALECAEGDG